MEAFAMRNRETGKYWSGKCGKRVWTTIGAAKSAWMTTYHVGKRVRFDDQTEYEIVRLVPEN